MKIQKKQSAFSELMIRIQSLRRNIDDANRALIHGTFSSLANFPEEVQTLLTLAQDLPKERRQQAIVALNALDADINAYTRILSLWQHQTNASHAQPNRPAHRVGQELTQHLGMRAYG